MANAIMLTKACISLTLFYDHDFSGRDISHHESGSCPSSRYNNNRIVFVFCRDGTLIVVGCLGLGLQSGKLIVGLVIFTITIFPSRVTEFGISSMLSQIFTVL